MYLRQVTSKEFNDFSLKNEHSNFYQTSFYGETMKKEGQDVIYLLLEENGYPLCGGLFLAKERKSALGKIKYAYAPRGFIIDFYNLDLVKKFTAKLNEFFSNLGISYIRIDPPIIHKVRDEDGEIIAGDLNNHNLIVALQGLGYEHLGFSLYFETLKPRWNSIIEGNDLNTMYENLSSDVKAQIKKAEAYGIRVIEGGEDSIDDFYKLIKTDFTKEIDYYKNLFSQTKNSNTFHIYFAKLEPMTFLAKIKDEYEREYETNNTLNQTIHIDENHLEHKIASDKRLGEYKSLLNEANRLAATYPNGLFIGSVATVDYKDELYFMNEGYNKDFNYLGTKSFLKWILIKNGFHKGITKFNLNGIPGDFDKNAAHAKIYNDNKAMGATVSEYLGEFDLIINYPLYNMFRVIPPLKQYLKK